VHLALRPIVLAALAAFAAQVGCASDPPSGAAQAASGLAGIYKIDSHTQNAAGCDKEGGAGPNIGTHLVIKSQSLLGKTVLTAAPCADIAACQTKQKDSTVDLSGWPFESGSDSAGWTGVSTSASGSGSSCSGTYVATKLSVPAAGKIAIDERTAEITSGILLDKDGSCSLDDVKTKGKTAPCTKLTVVKATFVQK